MICDLRQAADAASYTINRDINMKWSCPRCNSICTRNGHPDTNNLTDRLGAWSVQTQPLEFGKYPPQSSGTKAVPIYQQNKMADT